MILNNTVVSFILLPPMNLKYGQTAWFSNITFKAQPSKSGGVICNMSDTAIIITSMENCPGDHWNLTIAEARTLQNELSARVIRRGSVLNPRFIAGIDVSVSRFSKLGRASVVVLENPSLLPVETSHAEGALHFPYVPGYLSFREAPLIIEAWQNLKIRPDLLIVDGQGIAHPRRLGIASHLGLVTDIPSIGVAKSRLWGTHGPVPEARGRWTPLRDGAEIIGAVLRTRVGIKPLFISPGHRIGLATAIEYVMGCCTRYRLPETTRQAHRLASGPAS